MQGDVLAMISVSQPSAMNPQPSTTSCTVPPECFLTYLCMCSVIVWGNGHRVWEDVVLEGPAKETWLWSFYGHVACMWTACAMACATLAFIAGTTHNWKYSVPLPWRHCQQIHKHQESWQWNCDCWKM